MNEIESYMPPVTKGIAKNRGKRKVGIILKV